MDSPPGTRCPRGRGSHLQPFVSALAVVLLLAVSPIARSWSQEKPPPEIQDYELDLEKLYKVPEGSFGLLARRLVSAMAPQRVGRDYQARVELFDGEYLGTGTDGRKEKGVAVEVDKWHFKRRGRAEVLGGGRYWLPRPNDVSWTIKELSIADTPGKRRLISIHFRVLATEGKIEDGKEVITVLGREEMQLELIEHPTDKSLRLVLDPQSFLKKQRSLGSNWIPKEDQPAEHEPAKKKEAETQQEGAPSGPASEVTMVRSVKTEEKSMVVHFRKRWSGFGGRVVDGSLHIEFGPTLNMALVYDVPGKAGKVKRVQAAFFTGGNRLK